MSEAAVIFRELPATFPDKDKFKKPSVIGSVLSWFADPQRHRYSVASPAKHFSARTVDLVGVTDRAAPSSTPTACGVASGTDAAQGRGSTGPAGDTRGTHCPDGNSS